MSCLPLNATVALCESAGAGVPKIISLIHRPPRAHRNADVPFRISLNDLFLGVRGLLCRLNLVVCGTGMVFSPRRTRGTKRSRWSVSPVDCPRPRTPGVSGRCCAAGATGWTSPPRIAEHTGRAPPGPATSTGSRTSTPRSSVSPRARPLPWTPSSGSCWNWPGRRWRTRTSSPRRSRTLPRECSSAPYGTITRSWSASTVTRPSPRTP